MNVQIVNLSLTKGVFQLCLDPNKLSDLGVLFVQMDSHFVPYKLHIEIYKVVKEKDGLLQDALNYKLEELGIQFKTNQTFLNDIEIDCVFETNNLIHIMETKMYKINTSKAKLKIKIKCHFDKLAKDIQRLSENNVLNLNKIKPLLLLNIPDRKLLKEINHELKSNTKNHIYKIINIVNVSLLKFKKE